MENQDAQVAIRSIAALELQQKLNTQRNSLHEFLKFYWQHEKRQILDDNWHIKVICEALERVYRGECKRLIINIPPRSLKTEIVSKAFPVWALGNRPSIKFMDISYSSGLAEKNSGEARAMYMSQATEMVFPSMPLLREDQNTKQHWENVEGGQYYAAGSTGTITGIGADIIIIDDPINPEEANSELLRRKTNNNFHDTIKSRLNDKTNGAIIVIMQRLHDDDLSGHLMELESRGTGEKWDKIIIPAIAEEDDEYRKVGESFFEKRFPKELLDIIKTDNAVNFATQYQQSPTNKEAQEFHEEWFRYYEDAPKDMRIFTACDPAFKKGMENDYTAIVTAGFVNMDMYVLDVTVGRYDPGELIDKLVYHFNKRNPEKIGIEAYQAQSIIGFNLKAQLEKYGKTAYIEEITQTGDKEAKIRKLLPLYRNGHIYHKRDMYELEQQLKKFPRGKHDDIIDAEQMLYSMYELQPNVIKSISSPIIEYDEFGTPVLINSGTKSWL